MGPVQMRSVAAPKPRSRAWRALLVACALLAACTRDGLAVSDDASAATPVDAAFPADRTLIFVDDDLAGPDLAPPPDLVPPPDLYFVCSPRALYLSSDMGLACHGAADCAAGQACCWAWFNGLTSVRCTRVAMCPSHGTDWTTVRLCAGDKDCTAGLPDAEMPHCCPAFIGDAGVGQCM